MKALFLLTISTLAIVSCVEAGIKFERMSEAELAAYNEGKSISQYIVCTDDPQPFSRVRRRWCATVEQMYGTAANASQIGVLDSGQGVSDGGNF